MILLSAVMITIIILRGESVIQKPFILLYVDDIVLASTERKEVQDIKATLCSEFDMKDLGKVKKILGMDIYRDRNYGKLFLFQKTYLEKILCRFNMHQAKEVTTSIGQHFKLFSSQAPVNENDKFYMEIVPYASETRSLMCEVICTIPDLAFAVSVINCFMANPGRLHWDALKWTLRYIRGSSNLGLSFKYSRTEDDYFIGYVDADFAGNLDTKK